VGWKVPALLFALPRAALGLVLPLGVTCFRWYEAGQSVEVDEIWALTAEGDAIPS